MILSAWAARWGIPRQAVEELLYLTGALDMTPNAREGASESNVQSRVRLEAAGAGVTLWRNNVGAVELPDGSWLRYGLANDSKKLNEAFKSSDLVGFRPVVVTAPMVGSTIAQFCARECKPEGWRYSATPREVAQFRFIEYVVARGGDARFVTGTGSF